MKNVYVINPAAEVQTEPCGHMGRRGIRTIIGSPDPGERNWSYDNPLYPCCSSTDIHEIAVAAYVFNQPRGDRLL